MCIINNDIKVLCVILRYIRTYIHINTYVQHNIICDQILENGSKSHISISAYLSVPLNIEFNAQITEKM